MDIDERKKIVDEFNKQYKADVHITDTDDGEIISINEKWILDSEFMCYVYDNEPSPRITNFINEKILIHNQQKRQSAIEKYKDFLNTWEFKGKGCTGRKRLRCAISRVANTL